MHTHREAVLTGIFSSLSLALVAILLPGTLAPTSLDARIIEQFHPATPQWQTITEVDTESGATAQGKTNIFFHVPVSVKTISRETLLGKRGTQVRYWGYCFPDKNDPENPPQSSGFPGKLFLSEAERAWRQAQEAQKYVLSPFQRPQPQLMTHASAPSLIRHQIETFRGGMTCYLMSEHELPIGTDEDGDGLNSKLEKSFGIDPILADTDGDGLDDGKEVTYGTDPARRDSDTDGIIDGIEDTNLNGRLDPGETDPRKKDSDGDTFCDGACPEFKSRKICKDNAGYNCIDIPYGRAMGEDKNLNGKVDKGETDPRKVDSLGDGIRDDQRFFKCLLTGGTNC